MTNIALKDDAYDSLSNFAHDICTRFLPHFDQGERPKEYKIEQEVRNAIDKLVGECADNIAKQKPVKSYIKKLITELGEKILDPDRQHIINFYGKDDKNIDFYNSVERYTLEISKLVEQIRGFNMTNYTFEEKQIAIKVLEDLMAHEVECTRNLYYPFNFHLHAVPSNLIREKIKQLQTVTFGDIKNQVGTKFKTLDGVNFCIYKINGGDCMVANADLNMLYQVNTFNNQLPVEVINETETD